MHLSLALSSALIPWSIGAAQQPDVIVLEDLSFNCAKCARISDTECQASNGTEIYAVECSKLIDTILDNQLSSDQPAELPTNLEIIRYLLKGNVEPPRSKLLLTLLFRRWDPDELIARNVRPIAKAYADVVAELVQENALTPQAVEMFWSAVEGEIDESNMRLKAVLAARSKRRGLGDLLDQLSTTDLAADKRQLSAVTQAANALKVQWAPEAEKVAQFVDECLRLEAVRGGPVCDLKHSSAVSSGAVTYLRRVQVQQVIKRVEDKSLDVNLKLDLLAQIPFEEYRTPEVHRVLGIVLQEIEQNPAKISWEKFRDSRIGEMLGTFAASDQALLPTIERIVAKIKQGKDAPAEVPQASLRKDGVPAPGVHPLILLIAAGATLASCVGAGYYVWKRMSPEPEKLEPHEDAYVFHEISELNTLHEYFGLAVGASEEELRRIYRTKARELHPDAGGDARQFSELQEKYERLQELLEQYAGLK